jgi:hypothetical protein
MSPEKMPAEWLSVKLTWFELTASGTFAISAIAAVTTLMILVWLLVKWRKLT